MDLNKIRRALELAVEDAQECINMPDAPDFKPGPHSKCLYCEASVALLELSAAPAASETAGTQFWKDAESRRLFEQERLILDVTERICEVLEEKDMSRAQLADALGKPKVYISQLLDGSATMTLRIMSDVFLALGLRACVHTESAAALARSSPAEPAGEGTVSPVQGICEEFKAARRHGQQKYGRSDPSGHDLDSRLSDWLCFIRDHLTRAGGEDAFVSLDQREHLIKAGGLILSAVWSEDVKAGRIALPNCNAEGYDPATGGVVPTDPPAPASPPAPATAAAGRPQPDTLPLPKPGECYRHRKGGEYRVIVVADHSETREPMVVYALANGAGTAWARPAAMFCDGRFAPINAVPTRDRCEFCHGAKGGTPGNENLIRGKVVCDFCTSMLMGMGYSLSPSVAPGASTGPETAYKWPLFARMMAESLFQRGYGRSTSDIDEMAGVMAAFLQSTAPASPPAPATPAAGRQPAPDAPEPLRCTSTHCERAQECRSPNACTGDGKRLWPDRCRPESVSALSVRKPEPADAPDGGGEK